MIPGAGTPRKLKAGKRHEIFFLSTPKMASLKQYIYGFKVILK